MPQADVLKVYATDDCKVGFALFGDTPIPDAQGGYRPWIWLADFISSSIPAGSSPLYAAVRLEHALRNPTLGNRVVRGGGFLVAGYEGYKASAFEILCKSKSETDPTLEVGSWELPQGSFWGQPILRGCRNGYGALVQEVNLPFPATHDQQVEWFGRVVDVLADGGAPVAGPPDSVTIEPPPRPPFPTVEAEAPVQGR